MMLVRLNPWDSECLASIDPTRIVAMFDVLVSEEVLMYSPEFDLHIRSSTIWAVNGKMTERFRWLHVMVATTDMSSLTFLVAMPKDRDVESLREYYADPMAWDVVHAAELGTLRALPSTAAAGNTEASSPGNTAAIAAGNTVDLSPPAAAPAALNGASLCSSQGSASS